MVKDVEKTINRLFGCTKEPGTLQIYWKSKFIDNSQTIGKENTPIYETKGTLDLTVENPGQNNQNQIHKQNKKDQKFMQSVLEFAFIMAGFGKSWRRVWHQDFFPKYKTRAIGCHWEWLDSDLEKPAIQSSDHLKKFLDNLRQKIQSYLGVEGNNHLLWKEAWNPQRLTVYSQVVDQSRAIQLFHDHKFKTTPAIGGRQPNDERPKFFSCVWHRMLPIGEHQYLEIITLFYGKDLQEQWTRKENGKLENQFPLFIEALRKREFQYTWGIDASKI